MIKESKRDEGAIEEAGGRGVPARERGDAEPFDAPGESLCDLGALCPGGGVPFSDLDEWFGESKRLCDTNQHACALFYWCQVQIFTFFFAGCPEFFTRFLLLITSVFKLIGRGRPCSLRKRPHALQSTEPASSLLHSGVVEVVQFWHVGYRDLLVRVKYD